MFWYVKIDKQKSGKYELNINVNLQTKQTKQKGKTLELFKLKINICLPK